MIQYNDQCSLADYWDMIPILRGVGEKKEMLRDCWGDTIDKTADFAVW